MTATPRELERFRELLGSALGLAFDEHRWVQLAEVLERRARACGSRPDAYLAQLAQPRDAAQELRTLVSELTVGETYFFRNSAQLRALTEVVLPERVRVRRAPLRVLCVGCASGEEAYTLAIVLHEQLSEHDFTVQALDANPVALQKAARARYSAWALRETPQHVQQRWFTREGEEYALDQRIVTSVKFEERNLAEAHPDLFLPEHFDIVFFRNVLMYFTHETARSVVARVARSLASGGYLFLGHAETLQGLSTAFHLRHTHETFYYQRKQPGEELSPGHLSSPARGTGALYAIHTSVWPPAADGGYEHSADERSWIDTIQRSSGRIAQLAEPGHQPGRASASLAARPLPDLQRPLALLQEERFAEALSAVEAVPDIDTHSDALLLRAALLTHSGQLQAAELATAKLLELDELHAGAHYLRALCRESNGDRARAIWHHQIASYLDPAFAMPHLHLGLLARRSADLEGARRELSQALLLLEREDATRVLLFGGGFGRDMLIKLCRTELAASGGAT